MTYIGRDQFARLLMWTCTKCGEKIEDQFDSCWKCAGEAKSPVSAPVQRLRWQFCGWAAVASILAPVLADCVHSLLVVSRGIRFYQAELGYISTAGFWVFLGSRALVTFLVVLLFVRLRFADWLVWLCAVAFWIWLDVQREVVYK